MLEKYGRLNLLFVLLLSTATIAIYFQALSSPFIYDDFPHLVDNSQFRNATSVKEILKSGYQETRPLFLLSMAMTYQTAGLQPFYFHLTSLIIHLSCGLLLLAMLLSICQQIKKQPLSPIAPYLISAVFLLHPLQTESVTYINSRSGLLMAFFSLLAINLFICFRTTKATRHKTVFYIATCLSLILADLSKESGAVVPLLLVIIDSLIWRKVNWRIHLPMLATMLTVPLLYTVFHNPHVYTIGLHVSDGWYKVLTQPKVLAHFLLIYLIPFGQNIDYDFPLTRSLGDATWWLAVVVHAIMLTLAYRARLKRPLFSLGVAWYYISMIPTNSIVPFHDFIAERHLYLGLAGISLLFFDIAHNAIIHRQLPQKALLALALIWIVYLGYLAVKRNHVWSSEVALWQDAVSKSPNKFRAYANLGAALADAKLYDQAIINIRQAIHLDPQNSANYFNLGLVYKKIGNINLAIENFKHALSLRPDYLAARLELSTAYAQASDQLNALSLLQQGLDLGAEPYPLLLHMSRIYSQIKNYSMAEIKLQQLIDRYPKASDAWLELAKHYAKSGNISLAHRAYLKADKMSVNNNDIQKIKEFYQRYLLVPAQ